MKRDKAFDERRWIKGEKESKVKSRRTDDRCENESPASCATRIVKEQRYANIAVENIKSPREIVLRWPEEVTMRNETRYDSESIRVSVYG